MKSLVETWLQRQLISEVLGNLAVGALMVLISLPLVLINITVFWFFLRLFGGGNPLNEFMDGKFFTLSVSLAVALALFIAWGAAFVAWHEWRERRKLSNPEPNDDNPPIWDTTLIVLQILFAAPGTLYGGLGFCHHAWQWMTIDVSGCSQILGRLLSHPRRLSLDQLKREFPELNWERLLKQLHLVPGVVFLTSPPAGLSLTGEFRQNLLKHKIDTDWQVPNPPPPPPKEDRILFSCMGCGQKLRIRAFQKGYSIRCPKCHKRYRGYLDSRGRLRIEPEPEQRRRAAPNVEQDELMIHFRVLGVPVNSNLETVRRSYRKLMKQYHPDLYAMADAKTKADAEEKSKQINEAYHAIMDYLEGKER